MRRYGDPVEVRKGWVGSPGAGVEGPEQFLWRGRLWKVREVVAHWVETGPWWTSATARAVTGSDDGGTPPAGTPPAGLVVPTGSTAGRSATGPAADLTAERELWRVEAGVGAGSGGVFDLSFDWADGRWQLVGCLD